MMIRSRILAIGILWLVFSALSSGLALADDSQPAYLEITETTPDRYKILWRAPNVAGRRSPISGGYPDVVRNLTEPVEHKLPNSLVERRLIETDTDGLMGKGIEIIGLTSTNIDVLVRVEFASGATSTMLVQPDQAWLVVEDPRTDWQVTWDYAVLGVEHILAGFDHLLFVLALLLIVSDTRRLLMTITAFTLAHRITLAAATLGLLWVSGPPVEATIALSILFLARVLAKSGAIQ